jgi:two-component system nitrate/nitrite response regulator NarL
MFFALKKNSAGIQRATMNSLTTREREIVFAVAKGLSNKDVGRRLNLSEGTVKVHLHKIYSKLGVKNRTALVTLAYTKFTWARTLPHIVNFELGGEPEFA